MRGNFTSDASKLTCAITRLFFFQGSQSHRQSLLFDAKYPLTSENSPHILSAV